MPEEAYLAAHLQTLMAEDPRVHEPELVVSIDGDVVRVEGVVPTPERRGMVEEVLVEACPDHRIDNRVKVAAAYEPSETTERIP